jgi:SAM-dependent methyltransferase
MMIKEGFQQVTNNAKIKQKNDILLEFVVGKQILDVGCVGQDKKMLSNEWLHSILKNKASLCHGVDIELDMVDELQNQGYHIYSPQELEKINTKYDIVVMADVIEHVNDPVEFISYYGRFLKDEGIILLTTPNSNAIRNFVQIVINNRYSVNPQHTFWFCPLTLLEVTERAGYKPVDFFWLKEYHTVHALTRRIDRLKFRFSSIMYRFRSNFSPNFLLTIKKA